MLGVDGQDNNKGGPKQRQVDQSAGFVAVLNERNGTMYDVLFWLWEFFRTFIDQIPA